VTILSPQSPPVTPILANSSIIWYHLARLGSPTLSELFDSVRCLTLHCGGGYVIQSKLYQKDINCKNWQKSPPVVRLISVSNVAPLVGLPRMPSANSPGIIKGVQYGTTFRSAFTQPGSPWPGRPDRSHRSPNYNKARELAKLLRVSRGHIYKLAKSIIPCFHLGTSVRFDPRAVAEFLRNEA
jgi:hypothetical protein